MIGFMDERGENKIECERTRVGFRTIDRTQIAELG